MLGAGYYHHKRAAVMAICAVEMAMWDAFGKVCGQPLYRLWGGRWRQRIPLAAYLLQSDPVQVVDGRARVPGTTATRRSSSRSATTSAPTSSSRALVREVDRSRRAAAPRRERRVDAGHGASANADAWCRSIPRTSSSRSSSTTSRAMPRCAPSQSIPIALDESAYTLQDVGNIVRAQAADVILLDPHEAGGLWPTREGRGGRRVRRHPGHAAQRRRARPVAGRVPASRGQHPQHVARDRQRAQASRGRRDHGAVRHRARHACRARRRRDSASRSTVPQSSATRWTTSPARTSTRGDRAGSRPSPLTESDRRKLHAHAIRIVGVACAALAVACAAAAQDYPTKPVRILVPYPPGGASDVTARVLADKLSKRWGKPVFVENKAGANGVIGTETIAHAEPDGHTMGLVASSHVTNHALMKKVPYAMADMTPVTITAQVQLGLVVHPLAAGQQRARARRVRQGAIRASSPSPRRAAAAIRSCGRSPSSRRPAPR